MGSTSDLHAIVRPYRDFLITKSGALVAPIVINGVDPTPFDETDYNAIGLLASSVYRRLPSGSEISAYYIHSETGVVDLSSGSGVSGELVRARNTFLSGQGIAQSLIVHFVQIAPSSVVADSSLSSVAEHTAKAIYSSESRQYLSTALSGSKFLRLRYAEIEERYAALMDIFERLQVRLGESFGVELLSHEKAWRYINFIANLDSNYLDSSCRSNPPSSRWDLSVSDGDVSPMSLGSGVDVLRVAGTIPKYVSVFSVNSYGEDSVRPGLWSFDERCPTRRRGNYYLLVKFTPYGPIKQAFRFSGARAKLTRDQFKIGELLSSGGSNARSTASEPKPHIKQALQELDEAEQLSVVWGSVATSIVTWATDRESLLRQRRMITTACDNAAVHGSWESVGLMKAYRSVLVSSETKSLRHIDFTSAQFAAAGLFYRAAEGQRFVPELNGHDCLYAFRSEDGSPFYFSPWAGFRNLVIGVGPIRSGKTFLKSLLAMHFSKYEGVLHAIDVDAGMEPVAQLHGDRGGVYRVDSDKSAGFNPFASCSGPGDFQFTQHLRGLILLMLQSNDTPDFRVLTTEEQASLDAAITAVLHLGQDFWRLSYVWEHCCSSLKEKLSRWVYASGEKGIFASFMDAEKDSAGSYDLSVMAYNLASIRDDSTVLPVIISEIFFRVTRSFNSPALLTKPKYLDIDEGATLFQGAPEVVERVISIIRNMGKQMGGVGIWSQGVGDYEELPSWPVIRSAASTFFFMADPTMDRDSYKKVFQLSNGECDAIASLIPKREAFVIQRSLGVSKKIIIDADALEYAVATSSPSERSIRDAAIKEHGEIDGLKIAADLIEKQRELS